MEPSEPKHRLAGVDRLLVDVAGVALVVMMVATVGSSLTRFFFAAPIPDVEAIDEMLMVVVILLPFAFLQMRRGHVEVTLFTDRLPARAKAGLAVFAWTIGLAGFGLLLYALTLGAYEAWELGDAYFGVNMIPTWPARAVAAVGVAAMTLRLLLDLVRDTRVLLGGGAAAAPGD